MTRKKEMFWGIYAAIMPCIAIYGIDYSSRILEGYIKKTFNSVVAYTGGMALDFVLGLLLAALAVYFLSRPKETCKIPMIGLCIGLVYCAVIAICWLLLFIGIQVDVMWWILPMHGGLTKAYLFLGYYIVLLIVYRKTRVRIPKENVLNIGE